MTTLHLRNSIGRSPLRRGLPRVQSIWILRGFILIPLVFACFALSPTARAVSPAPDGGYPNNNTAEGDNALFSLTTGFNNTANGFEALFSNRDGGDNTANGYEALHSNTTGSSNTATGYQALYNNTAIEVESGDANTANGWGALFSNTTGSNNTATGVGALGSNTTANYNTATGAEALQLNTTGNENTATGVGTLENNTTGSFNTADGGNALTYNTTGNYNTATGLTALFSNTTGIDNTANGYQALYGDPSNFSTGSNNTANGYRALYSYTTGGSNTANGGNALYSNTTGGHNTANGYDALHSNTTGDSNTANGIDALYNNTTGNANIAVGRGAGGSLTTGSGNIDIANPGVAAEANTVRIGTVSTQTNAYVAGIYAATVAKGLTVLVDSTGHLGTKGSSERFKERIKPMDKASEAILALKPVTFQYKKELDPEGVPQFGLVAEQVEKVNPDLVARDAQGKVYTVRYDAVNAMLLNEFLKEHRTVQELKSTAAKQEAIIAKQQKQIEALATGLQKVSDELELKKPASRTVLNNQ